MGGCLAELSVQTAIHPVDPVASHRYEKWFHAHPDKWRKMHRQVGCFSPGHPTQAAWFSHECSFNPLPFSRRPQEHRLEEQVEIPLGLSSLGPARVLGEVCVRHRSSVHSSEVEGCQKSLTDAPWPCRSIYTHTHTHTRMQAETLGDRGPGAQCNCPVFPERLRKRYLTWDPLLGCPRGCHSLPGIGSGRMWSGEMQWTSFAPWAAWNHPPAGCAAGLGRAPQKTQWAPWCLRALLLCSPGAGPWGVFSTETQQSQSARWREHGAAWGLPLGKH